MTLPALTRVDDERRRRALRSMKLFAGGLLVVAALVYVVARRWESSADAPAIAGYLRSAAEAGMVGGLADWFAVTALFRRPLGLPIPHTAIIPTRKDQIGDSLGEFVGSNFLSADAVRDRLRSAQVTARVGGWLATEANAERVAVEAANLTHAGIELLRDDDLQPVIEQLIERRLQDLHLGPAVGRTLAQVVRDKAHRGAVDLVARSAHQWLVANEERITELISDRAPRWSPRVLDRGLASLAYGELLRLAGDVEKDPEHAVRQAVDRYLSELAEDLQQDPATAARLDAAVRSMGERADIREAVGDLLTAGRKALLELVDDPDSQLRQRLRKLLMEWGQRLVDDPGTAAKVDARIEAAAVHVVTEYRGELTRLVTDTVQRWDAVETSRRIELQVGRDLQFIRVNGTVVGSLVGILIHAVSQLL